MLAATAQAAEVSKLNRKLRLADEELDRINKQFDETQGMRNLHTRSDMCINSFNLLNFMIIIIVGAVEVESLKSALAQAQKEAEMNRAAARKATKELEAKQTTHQKQEARVGEVEQELKDAITKCESLEQKTLDQASELAKALRDIKEAWVESQSTRQEIQQARQIAACKTFLPQSKFAIRRYILLTRVWSSPGAFVDLSRSVADAVEFFRAK